MPDVDAIIQYGEISEFRMIDEPYLLVQSLTFSAAREKQSWKGATTLAINALRYTNPILTIAISAIIGEIAGMANQHPGTLVTELANFTGNVYEFEPDQGIMVFEDPTRSLTLDQPAETDFSVLQYPFVGEDGTSWTPTPIEEPEGD